MLTFDGAVALAMELANTRKMEVTAVCYYPQGHYGRKYLATFADKPGSSSVWLDWGISEERLLAELDSNYQEDREDEY